MPPNSNSPSSSNEVKAYSVDEETTSVIIEAPQPHNDTIDIQSAKQQAYRRVNKQFISHLLIVVAVTIVIFSLGSSVHSALAIGLISFFLILPNIIFCIYAVWIFRLVSIARATTYKQVARNLHPKTIENKAMVRRINKKRSQTVIIGVMFFSLISIIPPAFSFRFYTSYGLLVLLMFLLSSALGTWIYLRRLNRK